MECFHSFNIFIAIKLHASSIKTRQRIMPTSRQPTAAALARLELLKRAFNAVMAAQWLCLDAEKLGGSFVPLLF